MALYIKYKPADTGSRAPSPCSLGEAMWLSSSIWLTDTSNNLQAKARVGTTSRIHVQVDSSAGTYTPVTTPPPPKLITVQVWVCNPTVGVGPNAAVASAGGPGGLGGPIFSAISPGTPQSMYVEWTPQAGDLLGAATESHLCVGANCFWNGTAPPAEGAAINSGFLDVCNNGHHGQRNINLLSATAPGPMSAEFMAPPPEGDGEEEIVLELIEVKRGWKLSLAEREQLVAEQVAKIVGLEKVKRPKYWGVPEPPERALLRAGAEIVLAAGRAVPIRPAQGGKGRGELTSEHGEGTKLKLTVVPGKQTLVTARLELAEDDKPGTVRAWDVICHRQRGRDLGALRIIAVLAGRR